MKFIAWSSQQIEWLKSFLSEPTEGEKAGKASEKRLVRFLTVITFVVVYLKTVLFQTTAFQRVDGATYVPMLPDIPPTWAALIFAVCGIAVWEKLKSNPPGGQS